MRAVGQFPTFFGHGVPTRAHSGLLITSALVLVIANLVDLSAIASVGSACSRSSFCSSASPSTCVGLAGLASPVIVLTAIAATAIVLVFFAVDTLRDAPGRSSSSRSPCSRSCWT